MKTSKKYLFASLFLLVCFVLSLTLGRYPLSLKEIFAILFLGQGKDVAVNIFYNIRLVRCLQVILCGAALSLAGFLYQSGFHNALVSPDTLGVSGGASVGAIIAILFFGGSPVLRQVFSFAGGILAVIVSLLLSVLIGRDRRISLLLAGIIVSALANSAIMAFKYLADPATQLAVIDYWLMGSFSLIDKNKLFITAVIILPCLILVTLFRYRFKALLLSEEEARTLGVDTGKLYLLCIGVSTLLTAASVSMSGIVSWIGLLTPHIVKTVFRSSFEETMLLCMPIGASLLLLSDTAARSLTMSEIPVSIITSLTGAVFLFLFLYLKKGRP